MSLREFFLSQRLATRADVKKIAESQSKRRIQQVHRNADLNRRVEDLEMDLGYVALILGALLNKVEEKGVLSLAEVREAMAELDEIDGVKDGKLDISLLRDVSS